MFCLFVKIVLELKGCFRVLLNGRVIKKWKKRDCLFKNNILKNKNVLRFLYKFFIFLVFSFYCFRYLVESDCLLIWWNLGIVYFWSYLFIFILIFIYRNFIKECESKIIKICEFVINYYLMNDIINIKIMYI